MHRVVPQTKIRVLLPEDKVADARYAEIKATLQIAVDITKPCDSNWHYGIKKIL